MRSTKIGVVLFLFSGMYSCSKSSTKPAPPTQPPASFSFNTVKVNGVTNGTNYVNVNNTPVIKLSFSAGVNHTSVSNGITIKSSAGAAVSYSTSYQNNDSTVIISPSALAYLTKYTLTVSTALKSSKNASLASEININLATSIDSTNKFPVISDDQC